MPILVIIFGVVLISLNYLAIKKEDGSFSEVLKKSDNSFTKEKFELGKLRLEMGETITELQQEIQQLRLELSKYEDSNKEEIIKGKSEEVIIVKESDLELKVEDEVISEINFSNAKKTQEGKANQIRELISQGFTDDEICQKLSLGKGEILLVRSLYKN